jgi:voltage-gated potassium channel
LLIGLAGLLLVLVAGTIGYAGFGLSLLDAVFQTVITVSTVGFGEARPFGPGEKVFTIVLILVGVATAAYTFGVAIDAPVEEYLGGTFGRRRMERPGGRADLVVVDASAERIATSARRTYTGMPPARRCCAPRRSTPGCSARSLSSFARAMPTSRSMTRRSSWC